MGDHECLEDRLQALESLLNATEDETSSSTYINPHADSNNICMEHPAALTIVFGNQSTLKESQRNYEFKNLKRWATEVIGLLGSAFETGNTLPPLPPLKIVFSNNSKSLSLKDRVDITYDLKDALVHYVIWDERRFARKDLEFIRKKREAALKKSKDFVHEMDSKYRQIRKSHPLTALFSRYGPLYKTYMQFKDKIHGGDLAWYSHFGAMGVNILATILTPFLPHELHEYGGPKWSSLHPLHRAAILAPLIQIATLIPFFFYERLTSSITRIIPSDIRDIFSKLESEIESQKFYAHCYEDEEKGREFYGGWALHVLDKMVPYDKSTPDAKNGISLQEYVTSAPIEFNPKTI